MDGRGGCCIARYAGGGGAYHMSKVDRIMLRFRPIAPKPAAGASGSTVESNGEVHSKCGRGKRKYSKENKNNSTINSHNDNINNKRCNRKRRVSYQEEKRDGHGGDEVVTLPLLPETPDRKESPARGSPPEQKQGRSVPMWLSFGSGSGGNMMTQLLDCGALASTDRTVVIPQAVRVMGSCVTVECVTDTWVDGGGLGRTDEEKRMNLARDTCPGFISDGFGRVTWTNRAYKEMVGQVDREAAGGGAGEENLLVWLVMKERPMLTYPAFTCRVRLQYTCGKERSSLTLPCDVWRMDGGRFAWRLDVKAALCLGR